MESLNSLTGNDTAKVISIDSKIRALAFLPDGCIVSGEESSVQLRRDESLMGDPIESRTSVLAVATSRDGSRIVTGTTDGLAIWNRQGAAAPQLVKRHSIGGVRTIDISSDSKWVVTGSDARTVDVWDLSTGERRFDSLRHEYNVIAVKFCPCGERLATATLFGSVRIFAIGSKQKILTIPISVTATISIPNVTFAWFAHRPQIFAVSQGQIKCLNSDDGSLIYQWALRGVTHPSSVALSPNSKLIAYSINDAVVLRDTATRQEIGGSLKHDGNVTCIAFSRGSDVLIVGADTKFTIRNLRRLLSGESYFTDTTEAPKSCTHHNEDPTRKPPPTTFSLPLMSISNPAVKGWLHGFLDHVEKVLSAEIEDPKFIPDHDIFANRALIRGRLGKGDAALEDANKSLSIRSSPIGEIAKAIAFIKQKEFGLAKQEIPKVLQSGHADQQTFLLEVVQSILSCLAGDYEMQVSHISRLNGDKKLLWLVQANMHLSEESFESAMESFNKARMPAIFPHDESREMWTIAFIFGWKFSGLVIQIQQRKCEFLLDEGDPEAARLFVKMRDTYQREIAMHVQLADWTSKFRKDCLKKLEDLGNTALESKNWSVAIEHFTAVEPLIGDLDAKYELLLKRSRAHSNIPKNWELALRDADEAIRLNPISPWGYEMRHTVLYTRRQYGDAAEALDRMLKELSLSKDAKSTELRNKGVKPEETKKIIFGVVEETLAQARPHVLINTESGRLCDKSKQTEAFKAHPHYKDLVLSPTSEFIPDGDWKQKVTRYFQYSTLSHTWEPEGEPGYREVIERTVESLDQEKRPIPIQKLQTYCRITNDLGYFWAWSDTCCINKDERETLDVALRSMYRWYSEASFTIVHLKEVHGRLALDFDELSRIVGDLLDEKLTEEFVGCRWNKRAWTLQEYFASRVIHFYTEDWEPYLPIDPCPDEFTNHKSLPAIQRGMELVTNLEQARLATLKPGSSDVREKLRLASTRQASRKEDVAYSLLGIFKVTIEAVYGDDEVPRALGRLLGALLTQSADVSILAWTGTSSEYNTCLPAEITVYQEPDAHYLHKPIEGAELAESISAMRSMPLDALKSAMKLHDRLLDAQPPELHYGRLKLPCILFRVPSVDRGSKPDSYTTTIDMLGRVEIKTKEDLTSTNNMVLVNPWFRRLMDPGIPLSELAKQESALKLLASLRQPFGALLLALTTRDYERVATDEVIKVKLLDDIPLDQLIENIRVLYIR